MFSKLTRSYYKGAGAAVYAFSTSDRASFLEIERWRDKVEAECGEICSVLVQNKIDLIDQAQMTAYATPPHVASIDYLSTQN